MAVNQSRSMSAEFAQGSTDNTYMSLTPDRGGVLGSVPSDRMSWPAYQQVEQHCDGPFVLDQSAHAGKDIERLR